MNWIDKITNAAFNFLAPKGKAENSINEVLFPVPEIKEPAAAATLDINIQQMTTIVNVGTMAADMTVNATIDDQVTEGALVIMKLTSDSTGRAVTFGTGFNAPSLSGVANKTKYATFMYDGTQLVPVGTSASI
jgi:hypothetical protein